MKFWKNKILSIIFGTLFLFTTEHANPAFVDTFDKEFKPGDEDLKEFTLYDGTALDRPFFIAAHRSHSSHSSHRSHSSHSSHRSSSHYSGTTHYNSSPSYSSPLVIPTEKSTPIPQVEAISNKKFLIEDIQGFSLPESIDVTKLLYDELDRYTNVLGKQDVKRYLDSGVEINTLNKYIDLDFVISGMIVFYDREYSGFITILNLKTGVKEQIFKTSNSYTLLMVALTNGIINICK